MATITHAGFRTLVHERGGCDLYFTEMISAEALVSGTPYEDYYTCLDPAPERTIYQLVGHSADAIVRAAMRLAGEPARSVAGRAAGIDVNMGCSAPQIVKKGGGVAWMHRREDTSALISELRRTLPDCSLSVKIRLGGDDDPQRLLSFCRMIEECGVDFVTLHPKKQKEGSSREARWRYVDILRADLGIPVVGNGGITSWETYSVRRDRDATTSAGGGLMVGRGAVRAPWLFAYLRGREADPAFTLQVDLVHVLERLFMLIEQHQPPDFRPSRARRLYPYLFQNVPFGHSVGAALGDVRDYEDGKSRIREFFRAYPQHRHFVERR